MSSQGLFSHYLESNSFHSTVSPGEIFLDYLLFNPYCLKDLGPPVGFNSGDADLSHDFDHAFSYRLNIPFYRLTVFDVCQLALLDHISQTFKSQVRVNRL